MKLVGGGADRDCCQQGCPSGLLSQGIKRRIQLPFEEVLLRMMPMKELIFAFGAKFITLNARLFGS